MKSLLLLSALFLVPFFSTAQGINFEHSAWNEVLAKAKSENKIIFMDAYTTWCGPCKMMSSQTFPNKEVGDYFNKYFVSVKMDMESEEGTGLAEKYNVFVYPTLLFIDGEGAVVHRSAGFYGAKEFLELGQIAAVPEKRLDGLVAKYESGDHSPELLYSIATAKSAAFDPNAGNYADEYIKTQSDKGSIKNIEFIYQYVTNPNSDGFQYLLKNKKLFENKYGQQQVNAKIEQNFTDYLSKKPDMGDAEVEALFVGVFPEEGKRLASAFQMSKSRQKGDREAYAHAAIAHYKKYPSNDPQELNETAWTFFKVVEDKKMLKEAAKWALKSVKLDDAIYNNDTLGSLYYKLGKKKKAIKYAQRAIELAKVSGEDYSETQNLLEKIYKL